MFGRESKSAHAVDILIGKTASVRGDIDFAGGLHLDGRVAGHVRANPDSGSTLSVSETGWIEGSAQAADVILNGTVRGDIVASGRVVLGPRAKVHGDVHYGVIETALGAEIRGRLVPVPAVAAVAAVAGAGGRSAGSVGTTAGGPGGVGGASGAGGPCQPAEAAKPAEPSKAV